MKIDHIQLAMPVGQEDAARAYFTGLLGMIEDGKPAPLKERGGCWFRLDATIVHVGVDPDFRPQRKAHPAFLVPDIDTLAQQLQVAGQEVNWDDALTDRRRFYTSDPFGNRLEFIADGGGFTQRLPDSPSSEN